ncbi:MAG: hypothetical protein A3G57_01030 [Candidatus Andersenbacteria bacterium RIFCSPLOWO2_12_FULL_45_8]|nr:MAG: hypothetical protein A3G57_01030 [Candidatus Andersenbacteria bacterium RIFCSPLOWO2_12_FULL_45_8]HBE90390.1 hypothetical protein [Candidatus Andersenbacteria bacterium]
MYLGFKAKSFDVVIHIATINENCDAFPFTHIWYFSTVPNNFFILKQFIFYSASIINSRKSSSCLLDLVPVTITFAKATVVKKGMDGKAYVSNLLDKMY